LKVRALLLIVMFVLLVAASYPSYLHADTPSTLMVVGFNTAISSDQASAFVAVHGGQITDMNLVLGFIIVSVSDQQSFMASVSSDSSVAFVGTLKYLGVALTPDDPYFSQQYLDFIRAPEAWDIVTGNPSIIVAVVDTGVDYNHPDLAGNMWTAPDGSHGWNFLSNNNNPMDDFTPDGHGTDVAGVIAALLNNGVGISGIAQVKIMAVKVCDGQGTCSNDDVASGIQWAVDHGANIINLSIGGTADPLLYAGVKYAADRGVLLVASAGNCNHGPIMYPAAYDEVIAVTGINVNVDRTISDVSCVGPQAELTAPVVAETTYTNNNYGIRGGTSFSAPYVVGVAALVKSHTPGLTASQIRSIMDTTAADLGPSGRDPDYGYGLVDAYAAVQATSPPPTPDFSIGVSPMSIMVPKGSSGTVTVTVTSINGFSSLVSLSASGYPSGVSVTFAPNPVTSPAGGSIASTVTTSVSSSTSTGDYSITITGTSTTYHSVPFSLNVPETSTQVTWQLSGVSSDAAGPILNIDGVSYTFADFPKSFSWNAGSPHTVSAATQITASVGKQYSFLSWTNGDGLSGPSGTYVAPSSVQTVTVNYDVQYYLTVQANPVNGGSTGPPSGWQNAGGSVQIAAAPNPGFNFVGWTGSGPGSYSGSVNPVTVTMNGPVTEIASFSGPISPIVMTVSYSIANDGTGYSAPTFNYVTNGASEQFALTSSPTNIQVDGGTAWSVTPNPLTGSSTAERWYSNQPLSDTASSQTIVFQFQHQYYLTVQVDPPGAGVVSPISGWQNTGTVVQLIATPTAGYVFDHWTGTYSGASNPVTVSMNAPVTETATFAGPPSNQYTITVNTNPPGLDNPQGNGIYSAGTSITISIDSVANYAFVKWQRDSVDYTTQQSFTYTVDASHTFTAVFQAAITISVTITSTPTGSGLVIVDNSPVTTPYTFNWIPSSSHTLSANSPASVSDGVQYVWVNWSDGGEQSHTITPSMPTNYTANFEIQYRLSMRVTGSGTVSPTVGIYWYPAGTPVQISATANSDYSFVSWTGEGNGAYSGTANPASITMNGAIIETANFQATTPPPSPPPQPPQRCIIATAAWGSELAPEVVHMRYVRDHEIGSTPIGKILRDGWNTFYYLWSPPIAQTIAANPTLLQPLFRTLLLPLVGVINITEVVFTTLGGGDPAAVTAFLVAAILSTLAYIVMPVLVFHQLVHRTKMFRAKNKA